MSNQNVKLIINKQTKDPNQLDYFKIEGNFNYPLNIEINGKIPFTQSNIQITSLIGKNKVPMAIDIGWFRQKQGQQLDKINTSGNLYYLSVLEEDKYLVVKVTPIEEEYFGECRIFYGPIKLSPSVRNRVFKLNETNHEEFKVQGYANNLKDQFQYFELDKGMLKACDSKYQQVYAQKLSTELMVDVIYNDPLKLKILNKNSKNQEIFMKMSNIEDKEVLHYFLLEKLQFMSENEQKNNPQKFSFEEKNVLEISKPQREWPSKNENDSQTINQLNNLMEQQNPLKVNMKEKISSRNNSLQKNSFGYSQRNVSQGFNARPDPRNQDPLSLGSQQNIYQLKTPRLESLRQVGDFSQNKIKSNPSQVSPQQPLNSNFRVTNSSQIQND